MQDVNEIKNFIPHRYPFLLIDRIVEIEKGKKAVGIKNISANDVFGHQEFLHQGLIFPGSLQVEAMAQVAAFVVRDLMEGHHPKLPLLASIDKARFRRLIRPGDQLRIEVILKRFKGTSSKFIANTYIDGQLASEVEFMCVNAEQ